jgi:hypothetical protein
MKKLHIKPSKQSLEYAKNFLQSNGGYQECFKEFKQEKELAPRPPVAPQSQPIVTVTNANPTETSQATDSDVEITPYKLKPPPRRPPRPPRPPTSSSAADTKSTCEVANGDNSINQATEFVSTSQKTPQADSTISYLSPIPTAPCFDSGSSSTSFNNSSLISNMCSFVLRE